MKKMLFLLIVILSASIAVPAFAGDRCEDDRPSRAEILRKKHARLHNARVSEARKDAARNVRRRHTRRHVRRHHIRRDIQRATDRRF